MRRVPIRTRLSPITQTFVMRRSMAAFGTVALALALVSTVSAACLAQTATGGALAEEPTLGDVILGRPVHHANPLMVASTRINARAAVAAERLAPSGRPGQDSARARVAQLAGTERSAWRTVGVGAGVGAVIGGALGALAGGGMRCTQCAHSSGSGTAMGGAMGAGMGAAFGSIVGVLVYAIQSPRRAEP